MALSFSVKLDVPLRPNYQSLKLCPETGRLRDINGNSYSRADLEDPGSESACFTVAVEERSVDGWSVSEILDALHEDAHAIARAFLLTEQDSVIIDGGVEVTLPAHTSRCSYDDGADSGTAVRLVDTENAVLTFASEHENTGGDTREE